MVKDGGGLLIPDGHGGEVLLDAAPFRELRALDCGEMKICPKLTKLCIEVCNYCSLCMLRFNGCSNYDLHDFSKHVIKLNFKQFHNKEKKKMLPGFIVNA